MPSASKETFIQVTRDVCGVCSGEGFKWGRMLYPDSEGQWRRFPCPGCNGTGRTEMRHTVKVH